MAEVHTLLRRVNSQLAELDHKMSAVEIAEDRRRQEAQARADSAAHLRSHQHLMEVQHAARNYQIRVDEALEPWGVRCPAPSLGEPVSDYRQRLLDMARKQLPKNHELRAVRPHRLDSTSLDIMEPQILSAVKSAATDPTTVPRGEFREVKVPDQSGRTASVFIGQDSFTNLFHRPGRRVIRLVARNAASGQERVIHGAPFSSRDAG